MYRSLFFLLLCLFVLSGCAAPKPAALGQNPDFARMLAAQQQMLTRVSDLEASLASLQAQILEQAEPAVEVEPEAQEHPTLAPAPPPHLVIDLFREAFSDFAFRRYAEAAAKFQRFILENPQHDHLASARFMAAESSFGAGNFLEAARQYLILTEDRPQDARVPRALERMGQAYEVLGRLDEARHIFEALEEQYPERNRTSEPLSPTGGRP